MTSLIAWMQGLLERAKRTPPGRVVLKVMADNVPVHAVVIAWNLLQTIFPIALALAAVLGVVLGVVGVGSARVLRIVTAIIPDPAGQQQVLTALGGVKNRTGLFALLAIVGFIWSASNLFGALERAFDLILHVSPRTFVRQKLMSILMMLLFCLLAGLAIATSSLLPLLSQLPEVPLLPRGAGAFVVQLVIGCVAGFILFFAIYFVVPNKRQSIRQVLPGAVCAGVAFELLTLVFPLYFQLTGPGMNQYGKTFALLFVLMTYMYFLGLMTMIGIEINSVLHPTAQPDRIDDAVSSREEEWGRPAASGGDRRREGIRGRLRHAGLTALGATIGLLAMSRRRT